MGFINSYKQLEKLCNEIYVITMVLRLILLICQSLHLPLAMFQIGMTI